MTISTVNATQRTGDSAPGAGPDRPQQPWTAFVTAQTSQAYFQGWLEVVCTQFAGVRAAALLVHDDQAANLIPIAVWPASTTDLSRLASTVQKAVTERRGLVDRVVKPLADAGPVADAPPGTPPDPDATPLYP